MLEIRFFTLFGAWPSLTRDPSRDREGHAKGLRSGSARTQVECDYIVLPISRTSRCGIGKSIPRLRNHLDDRLVDLTSGCAKIRYGDPGHYADAHAGLSEQYLNDWGGVLEHPRIAL